LAEHLVTGIAQSSSPEHLEDQLCKEPVNCDNLAVITKDSPTDQHHESVLTFMHVGQGHATSDVDHSVITGGEAILTNYSGPEIPNISSDNRYIGFFAEPHIIDHLAEYAIPEDQVQNYNDAIEAGRSVVVYKATPGEAPAVEQTFKDAGLKNVKTFQTK
jgi:rhodanese-related sulfurtransferase